MWIKCPICNGLAKDYSKLNSSQGINCNTCNGKGIINELTGKPPTWQGDMPMESQQEYFGTNKKLPSSGDFRDDNNRESQDEYFGRR